MATVDFTLDELKDEVRVIVREEVTEKIDGVIEKIESVRKMLEEDYRAEADRLTRVHNKLKNHMANSVHRS